MRKELLATMLLGGLAAPAAADYTEIRELDVDASGAEKLLLTTGAGSLIVEGVAGLDRVEVEAEIVIDVMRDSKGRKIAEEHAVLELDRTGNRISLVADFKDRIWGFGSDGRINLVVRAPADLALSIDDGSGSLKARGFTAEVRIDDGSGSIDVDTVGALNIDDGSGSITVSHAKGDVHITDGSGSITVEVVEGTVTIDDGSGSINVSEVSEDLVILDAGSGSVNVRDVRGTVEQDG